MKSLWRKIAFISAWVILVLGTVGAIVGAVQARSFAVFCQLFIPASFYFVILMAYLEHTNNVEMRMDQTYRKQNNLPQLPESAYTNAPFTSAPSVPAAPYQQPVQPQYQQPVQQYRQPGPAPMPTPVQPTVPQPWTCTACGAVNNPTANFCKGCGGKRG